MKNILYEIKDVFHNITFLIDSLNIFKCQLKTKLTWVKYKKRFYFARKCHLGEIHFRMVFSKIISYINYYALRLRVMELLKTCLKLVIIQVYNQLEYRI